jgi:S1-C subfamily serine protease
MNAIQGSASSAGSEQAPSAPEQPGGGIPYGSYGGSSTYGSYGASGAGNFGSPPGSGGAGGGHWSGGNWSGGNGGEGGQYPPKRRRIRRGMAFGAAGLAIAATAVGSYAAVQGGGSAAGHATTSSNTTLTTAQIATKVDPGLVDVISTLGDQSATAEGTGIVLTSTGEVLTNNHVIDGATSVKVVDIGNGKTYTATVVGYDKTKDVAVLKLQNASGLQTAPLGDSSSVAVGQNVTALGNAEGKGGTPSVATGQVTALGQSITASDEGSDNSEQLSGMIQSNVPIQPGDSGGSLVSSSGQVIGMDTAASSASDSPSSQADTPGASNGSSGDSGTGSGSSGATTATQAFSIPINTAETIAQEIVAGDSSSTVHIGATGFLGIEVAPANSSSTGSSSTGGSGDGGFGSTGGSDGSGFGSTGGSSDGGFGSTGGSSDGGFGGFGGSSDGGFGSTGGSDGSGFGSTGGSSDGGFGSTGGSDGSGTATSGATVEGTLSGSPAATAGLAAGDVITSVAGQTVTSPTQISSILSSDHPGDKVNVTWTDTSGASHTASITLAAGPAA